MIESRFYAKKDSERSRNVSIILQRISITFQILNFGFRSLGISARAVGLIRGVEQLVPKFNQEDIQFTGFIRLENRHIWVVVHGSSFFVWR